MTSAENRSEPRHPMRVVVRRTGLKAELIRAWERRYGAIEPRRSPGGHRLYSDGDVERLILLRRATEAGHAISRIAGLDERELEELAAGHARLDRASPPAGAVPPEPHTEGCLAAVRRLDAAELSLQLERARVDLGPARALSEVIAPLMGRVGDLWHRGDLRAVHEHLATSTVRAFVDRLTGRHQPAKSAPSLVVTTPVGQRHEMGAMLAAATAVLEGWRVTYLGSELPAEEIVAAARATGARAVALSLVYPADDPRLGDEIFELRRLLEAEVAILAGGRAIADYDEILDAARAVRVADLEEIAATLSKLRSPPPGGRAGGGAVSGAAPRSEATLSELGAAAVAAPSARGRVGRGGGARACRAVGISHRARRRLGIRDAFLAPTGGLRVDDLRQVRQLAHELGGARAERLEPRAGLLFALALAWDSGHRLLAGYRSEHDPEALGKALRWLRRGFGRAAVERALAAAVDLYSIPGVGAGAPRPAGERNAGDGDGAVATYDPEAVLEEMLLLWLANHNPAFEPLRELFDDRELETAAGYGEMIASLERFFDSEPGCGPDGESLFRLLRAPALAAPDSAGDQLRILCDLERRVSDQRAEPLLLALDVIQEEEKTPFVGAGAGAGVGVGPGPPAELQPPVAGPPRPAVRRREPPWMGDVVLTARNVLVWLAQLSRAHGRPIRRLDEIPDRELDRLAALGMSGLWLIGLWQRSPASEHLKRRGSGGGEAAASAYAVYDYRVDPELGGEEGLADLSRRAEARGIRLAADFVPNHMGLDSPWVIEHPERFLSLPESPFPGYAFTGEDLSGDPRIGLYLEDHYRDRSDAAVVFKRLDRGTGEERFVYHGNDGTSLPWNDTAQLDYLHPEVRELMIATLLAIARRFPIVRIDAAMTLVRQHVQRLWYPRPGGGGAIPSRSEHGLSAGEFDRRMPEEFWSQAVARLAAEAPGTLLLAEGFWLMEDYLVRGLGLDRVYNSAFMHLLRDEDNGRLRAWIRDALATDPGLLGRFVNFLTTPDEAPAVEQLGKGEKYFALCTLLAAMPGLPLFGHGQVEGLAEKYGMDYRAPRYTEAPDPEFTARHEREIAPLLHRRSMFAGTEAFRLYDFELEAEDGLESAVSEDVIALSNRRGEERALVVVHNRNAAVRGRLARAVPVRDPGSGGLRHENLVEALGLEPGDGSYGFRDRRTGAQMTCSRRELEERGLELELGPYGCRVFVDFR